MKENINNFFKVFSSNLFNLGVSVVTAIILPLVLSTKSYGYWSLYLLYVSYAGFFIFGYCDGIYLKIIGKEYEKLDFKKIKYFLIVLIFYLIIILIIFFSFLNFFEFSTHTRKIVVICSAFGIVLACLNSFFILLNQATQKYTIYAVGNMIEKAFILLLVIVCLIFKVHNVFFIILGSIIGKIITTIYYLIKNKNILITANNINGYKNEIFDNIKIGFTLTLSSIFSMLMTGIGKFFIESNFGIVSLAYYSFAFNLFSPLTQMIDAITLIIIPKLKQNVNNNSKKISMINSILSYSSPIILMFYFIGKICIKLFFPNYILSIKTFAFLCPLVILQCRISMIYNAYMKTERREKDLLLINFISILMTIIIMIIISFFKLNYYYYALGTLISYFLRDYISKIIFNKKYKINIRYIDFSILCIILYLVCIFLKISDFFIMFLLIILIFIISIINRKLIKSVLKVGKK